MAKGKDTISATTLADLARAGYSMSRQSFMQVNFEVHHIRDRGGYLQKILAEPLSNLVLRPSRTGPNGLDIGSEPEPQESYLPRETLSSGANGVGLVIATYAGTLHRQMHSRRQGSGLPVALKVDDQNGDRVFRGTAWPNPTFIYESARSFEGLISINEASPSLSHHDGLAIRELLHQISLIAKEIDAPLLLLHCPVQMPASRSDAPELRHRDEEWPRPSATAVRFAIALKHPTTELRLKLANGLSMFCGERGYGFWLADTRVGHRPGSWFPVRSYDPAVARRRLERDYPGDSTPPPVHCLPVTFVGPARVGSTHAILSYLRAFAEIGVLACSISSLDELAFIHLQLAIKDIPPAGLPSLQMKIDEAVRSAASAGEDNWTSRPDELLPAILPLLTGAGRRVAPTDVKAALIERVGNYQALAGPAMRIESQANKDRVALWFSWQTAGSDAGLAAPLIALVDAARAAGSLSRLDGAAAATAGLEPTIEYLICRDMGDSVLRGKGKMCVPSQTVTPDGIPTLETGGARLCTSLEDAWRAELEAYALPGVVELAVAWHEYRLDHPTTWP
jgi:hypothetical protein